jgi:hypothetical protein
MFFGVDIGAGKNGQTALVAMNNPARPQILAVRAWKGAAPTQEAIEVIAALDGQCRGLSGAVAVIESAWLGRNPQTALVLARQVGGWERMFEALGVQTMVVQPSTWREVLPKGAPDRATQKAAARFAAGAIFGAQAHQWTEHVCEAALMALWGARETERTSRLAQAVGKVMGGMA